LNLSEFVPWEEKNGASSDARSAKKNSLSPLSNNGVAAPAQVGPTEKNALKFGHGECDAEY
jgi:hypothetical protein